MFLNVYIVSSSQTDQNGSNISGKYQWVFFINVASKENINRYQTECCIVYTSCQTDTNATRVTTTTGQTEKQWQQQQRSQPLSVAVTKLLNVVAKTCQWLLERKKPETIEYKHSGSFQQNKSTEWNYHNIWTQISQKILTTPPLGLETTNYCSLKGYIFHAYNTTLLPQWFSFVFFKISIVLQYVSALAKCGNLVLITFGKYLFTRYLWFGIVVGMVFGFGFRLCILIMLFCLTIDLLLLHFKQPKKCA